MTSKNTAEYWENYYSPSNCFAKLFNDYAELKDKNRNEEERIQFRVVSDLIDGKLSL